MSEHRSFVQAYGRAIPPVVESMLEDRELVASAPHWFALPGKPFRMEVQYYVGVEKQSAEDVAEQRFVFAITTDGWEMLINLRDPELKVLQREHGDVDFLGITLTEFLAASAQRQQFEPTYPESASRA